MIYFDLDGVLRDIVASVDGWNPDTWAFPIGGQTVVEYFTNNTHLLRTAPPTEYLPAVLRNFDEVHIISSCPEAWQEATYSWIRRNIKAKRTYVKVSFDKLTLLKDDDILVEDYPHYQDYSKIILVDKPYNKNIELPHVRVTSPEALIEEIKRRQHGKV